VEGETSRVVAGLLGWMEEGEQAVIAE